MKIEIKKFGTLLSSRQLGREAFIAFEPYLKNISNDEEIMVDFTEVLTLSPAWGDEFITPLIKRYGNRLKLIETDNPSVNATIEIIEEVRDLKFNKVN